MLWTIAGGTLHQDGEGVGAVTITGELHFKKVGKADPSKMVVYSARLEGERGSGSYFQEGTRCAGTIRMMRLRQSE